MSVGAAGDAVQAAESVHAAARKEATGESIRMRDRITGASILFTAMKPTLALPLLAALALVACGSHDIPTRPQNDRVPTIPDPEGAQHDQVDPPTPPTAATDVVTDTGFELRALTPGPYHAATAATFGITLTARGNYHVNQEYPIKVTLHAPPAVTLPKSELARADAAHFDEHQAAFDVAFTPTAAGAQHLTADVDFAVCTPENCMPDSRTVAVNFPVQ